MTVPIYREGDEVEVTRRGVIVVTDPRDPHRYGIGRPGRYGADAYFRTDDDEVSHRLVSETEPAEKTPAVTAADLAATLLESIEDGNIPGSPIRYQGQEIWLHTSGQVEGWLRTHLEKAGLIEPVEDDWTPEEVSRG